ncbi:MAG TPA: sulfatase, partial [Acidobacteriota bacterium]|nr:sulfatase [Acidobacteriota bacterium]
MISRKDAKAQSFIYFLLLVSAILICSSAFAAKPNVLLISIDTLRADHLGCYGYSKKTPAIDSLASRSVLFENTISQVPLTLPSHCTIFTGMYPDQHGVRNNENFVLAQNSVTIAELFRQSGYSTGAVVGSFSLDSTFQVNQGFQYYEDKIGVSHDPELNRHVERRAETVWKLGKQWLQNQKGPWFCFLHFFDPHFGYNPPTGYPQTYDGEIGYTDKVIADILQFLKGSNYYSTTIVVLLSDHGEALGDHGEENHGVFL